MSIVAGWYPDPLAPERLRWWSGAGWTEHVQAHPVVPQPVAAHAVASIPTQRRPSERTDDVWLPPWMLEHGDLPLVCVRHGRAAVGLQKVTVQSRPPAWAYPFLLAGVVIYLIVTSSIRVDVTGGWPMCDHCARRRQRRRSMMWVCTVSWVLAAVAGVLLASGLLMLLLIPLFVGAVAARDLSDWRRFTSATVDRATNAIHVVKPSRGFVEALPDPRREPARQLPVGVRRF